MSNYVIGAANILGAVFIHALLDGKFSRTEAGVEFWSNWREQHPAFSQYGPPFLAAFGALRIVFGLLG